MSRNSNSQLPDRPEETLRDGNLKASIWRNNGENGPYYTTTLARTFTNRDGQPQDSYSFGANDLLRLGELARMAYHRTNDLRRDHTLEQQQEQNQDRNTSQRGRQQYPGRGDPKDQRREEFNRRRGPAPDADYDLSR